MIDRLLSTSIEARLSDGKAIVVLGPRQAGKTTLLRRLEGKFPAPVLWWNGDEADVRAMLREPTSTRLRQMVGASRTVVIDEAQRIEGIGICIKLMTDNLPGVQVIATGSSSFELASRLAEPLTGRKWEFTLLPFSYGEMARHNGALQERRVLAQRLLFGYYPDVVNHPGREREILKELSGSYLYKDILAWQQIRRPAEMERLLQALALQVGNEVSASELGQLCGISSETVERYLDLLEKAFIVFRLGAFSRNLRNELKKARKVYFYDNGIRNAVINNFVPIETRADTGALWENFLVAERRKGWLFRHGGPGSWFWRTHAQQEVDYVEEVDGRLYAWEFKWNPKSKARIPKPFRDAYPELVESGVVTPENFEKFLLI